MRRTIISVLIISLLFVAIAGCGDKKEIDYFDKGKIKETVEGFCGALINGDYDKACQYYCRESARPLWEGRLDEIKEQLKREFVDVKDFKITHTGEPSMVNVDGHNYLKAYVDGEVYLDNEEHGWREINFGIVVDSGGLIIESFGMVVD